MSLTPIPARMLHDTATFHVVTGMTRWQDKKYKDITVRHVHLQNEVDSIKGSDNTEVQLRGVLFVDTRRSTPEVDLYAMQQESLAAGDTMRVTVTDASGQTIGDFAVLVVDGVPDVPATRTHHWELGLV